MFKFIAGFVFLSVITSAEAFAQSQDSTSRTTSIREEVDLYLKDKWYERIGLRGYAQFRYNRLGETNSDLTCRQCDKSIGDNNGFFLRRGRLVLSGQVSENVFVYIQPDYGTESSGVQNYFQIRDAYFDYSLDEAKEWRARFGLSKVPYGFENLQSSSNRAPLDRNDAMNSAIANERDIGVFVMYTPKHVGEIFKKLTRNNLKGSGDYGMFTFGAYNGQTANQPEANNDLHRVVRFSYPHEFSNGQIVEASVQAYEGKYNITAIPQDFYDARQAVSFILYPRPFGFQIEANKGVGPEYDVAQDAVVSKDLIGGYAMLNYQVETTRGRFFPYVRYFTYQGGKKHEGGRAYDAKEWDIGTEWQPNPAFEFTASYVISDRFTRDTVSKSNHQKGNLIRLQAQFNY